MSRMKNGFKAVGEYFRLKHRFGSNLASLTMAKHLSKPGTDSWKALDKAVNQRCVEILKKFADPESFAPKDFNTPIGKDCPIWVYWAQGMENAPEIIQVCYRKLLENRGRHEVILLTQENLHEYVEMPEIFQKRLEQGCFGYTHYSDLVRICLLRQKGGLYLDAGMMLTSPIPDVFFERPFYTVNHGQGMEWLIGHGLWIAGVLGMAAGHPMAAFVQDVLERYWRHNKVQCGYLLFDDAMKLCMELFPEFRKQVFEVPMSCRGVFDLVDRLGEPYNELFFKKTLESNYMLRLSYKLPPLQGEDTIYHHLLKL